MNDNIDNIKLPLSTITKIMNRKIQILKLYPREFYTIFISGILLIFIFAVINLFVWFFTGSNVIINNAIPIVLVLEIFLFILIRKINNKYGEDAFFVFFAHFTNSIIYGDFKESFSEFMKQTFPKINKKIIK